MTRSGTGSSVVESVNSLATLVESNPKLWRMGLDGSELSAENEPAFRAMVTAVDHHFANMAQRWARLAIGNPDNIAENYAYAVYVHPGLRNAFIEKLAFLESGATAFGGDRQRPFHRRVVVSLERLDALSPEIPETKAYVFW